MHLPARDFTESNEKLLKTQRRERNVIYLEPLFHRLSYLIPVPKNPLRAFALLSYNLGPDPRDSAGLSFYQLANTIHSDLRS